MVARIGQETPGFNTQEHAQDSTSVFSNKPQIWAALTLHQAQSFHASCGPRLSCWGGDIGTLFAKGGAPTAPVVTSPEMESTLFPHLLGNGVGMAVSVRRWEAGTQQGALPARTQVTDLHSQGEGPPLRLARFCLFQLHRGALTFDGHGHDYSLLFTQNRQPQSSQTCSHM